MATAIDCPNCSATGSTYLYVATVDGHGDP
jgi:hypothetical protein